jgi:hypothetical protein
MAFRLHFYGFVTGEGLTRKCTLTSKALLEWLRREIMESQVSGGSNQKPNIDFYSATPEALIRLKEICESVLEAPQTAPESLSLFSEFDDEEEIANYTYGKNYFHNLKKFVNMVEDLEAGVRYYFTYHY